MIMYNYDPDIHATNLTDYHTIEIKAMDGVGHIYSVGTMSEQSAKAFIAGYSDITVDKIIFDDGPDYIAFCVEGRDNMDWFYDVLTDLIYPID